MYKLSKKRLKPLITKNEISNRDKNSIDILFNLSDTTIEFFTKTIGRKWALLVIFEIGKHEKIRYNTLYSKIEGISPTILSALLKNLEEINIITRKSFDEIPPRVEYSLSKKGEEFQESIKPLIQWADKNEFLSKHRKCNTGEKVSQEFSKFRNKNLRKLIEASMCACACLPLMTVQFINLI